MKNRKQSKRGATTARKQKARQDKLRLRQMALAQKLSALPDSPQAQLQQKLLLQKNAPHNMTTMGGGAKWGSPLTAPDQPPPQSLIPPLPPEYENQPDINLSFADYVRLASHEYVEGDRDLSITMYREVTNRDPNQPDSLFRMAITRGRREDNLEAVLLLRRAYNLAPDHYPFQRNYALALTKYNDTAEAIKILNQSLKHPKCEETVVLHDLATNLMMQKEVMKSIGIYEKLLTLEPDNPTVHYNLAINYQHFALNQKSEEHYKKVIELRPDFYSAYLNLSHLYRHSIHQEAGAAEALLQKLVDMAPDNYQNHLALYGYYVHKQDMEKAATALAEAEALAPNDQHVIDAKAEILYRQGRFADAYDIADAGLKQYPEFYSFDSRKFDCLIELARYDEALNLLQTADQRYGHLKTRDPDSYKQIKGDFCHKAMHFGYLEEGFYYYETRFEAEDNVSYAGKLNNYLPEPYLQSTEQAKGKTVLVYVEQGIGDIVMMARYMPLLNQIAGRVKLLYTDNKDIFDPLFKNTPGMGESYNSFLEMGDPEKESLFDTHCAIMSLPNIFKISMDNIPPPYAPPLEPDLLAHWHNYLGPKTKPRIGLVVSGNQQQGNDFHRSARLEFFQDLLTDKAEIILVQRDLRPHDVALADQLGLRHLGKEFQNLADTAAAFMSFDLLIGVETGIMHLAATLGRPTWALLASFPDWRYFLNRSDSPFYPSMRLFRQQSYRDWQGLAARVRPYLDQAVETGNFLPDLPPGP